MAEDKSVCARQVGEAGADDSSAPHRGALNRSAWITVLMLSFVGVLNVLDRNLPAVLAELIKKDLALSDTAIGLINGFGFLIVYAVAAIPIARAGDRRGYGFVISACVALWGLMTLLGGYVQTGWQLAMSRLGVALGEAGAAPCSQAFIASKFPPESRAAPLAVLNLSIPISTLIAMVGGGYLGETVGWRGTMIVMGAITLAVAVLFYMLFGRGDRPKAASSALSVRQAGQLLAKPSYRIILLGAALMGIGAFSHLTFVVAFLMRVHHFSVAEAGLKYGVLAALAGGVAVLVMGFAVDRLTRRDPRWLIWLMALVFTALAPVCVASYMITDPTTALYFLAINNCIAVAYTVPVVAAVQWLAPAHMRALASALLLFFTAIIGGIGPLLTGVISDALSAELGALALGRGLLVVPASYMLAGLTFALASRSFLADLEDRST